MALGIIPTAPWLARYLPQAGRMELAADIVAATKAVAADGRVLASLAVKEGEAFLIADVPLAAEAPGRRLGGVGMGATLLSGVLLGHKQNHRRSRS